VLFALAFFVVLAILGARAIARKRRERPALAEFTVAGFADVDRQVSGQRRCACGRRFDVDGEGPRKSKDGSERWGVNLVCVCGRRRTLLFVVAN
jgi:hypothetical protein